MESNTRNLARSITRTVDFSERETTRENITLRPDHQSKSQMNSNHNNSATNRLILLNMLFEIGRINTKIRAFHKRKRGKLKVSNIIRITTQIPFNPDIHRTRKTDGEQAPESWIPSQNSFMHKRISSKSQTVVCRTRINLPRDPRRKTEKKPYNSINKLKKLPEKSTWQLPG